MSHFMLTHSRQKCCQLRVSVEAFFGANALLEMGILRYDSRRAHTSSSTSK